MSKIVLSAAILAVTITGGGCSRKPNAVKEFTQCVRSIDQPIRNEIGLIKDGERGCYGVRWRIPAAFRTVRSPTYGPSSEALYIYVDAETRQRLEGSDAQSLLPPVKYKRFEIIARFESPHDRIARSIATYAMSMKAVTPVRKFGMISRNSGWPETRNDVLFYSDSDPTLYVICRAPGGMGDKQVIERTLCEVRVAFHQHFDFHYFVPYVDLPQLESINQQMIFWINSFNYSENKK